MTATAISYSSAAYNPAAYNPAAGPQLDLFDDADALVPARPQLRLIQGGAYGQVAAATQPRKVEMYRRRRFVALLAITLIVLAGAWAAGISVATFGGDSAAVAIEPAPAVHLVLPGDSYGAIAAKLGASNPVSAAESLRVANGGGDLVVGQRLVVDLTVLLAS